MLTGRDSSPRDLGSKPKVRAAPRRNGFGRAVSRILSAPLRAERIICLSSQYPEPIPLARELERAAPLVPYLALHPMGFSRPPRLRLGRCALTAPFHPCLAGCPARRSHFLWHFPSARLTANRPRVSPTEPELRGIAPCGVRTFLPRREPGAILHPSEAVGTVGQRLKWSKAGDVPTEASPSLRSRQLHVAREVDDAAAVRAGV